MHLSIYPSTQPSLSHKLYCVSIIFQLEPSNNTNKKYRLFPSQNSQSGYSCSVAQLGLTLCDPMDCSMPGFPVLHCLLEFAQTHVHCVNDAIQLSHPLSPPFPPAFNLSQHQGLFKWVSSSHYYLNFNLDMSFKMYFFPFEHLFAYFWYILYK